jgi:hypothetical protein
MASTASFTAVGLVRLEMLIWHVPYRSVSGAFVELEHNLCPASNSPSGMPIGHYRTRVVYSGVPVVVLGDAVKRYQFKAKIEASDGGGAFVLFPFNTEAEFGTKGKVAVKARVGGVPYVGSLMSYGRPQHMLAVAKAIRQEIGKGPGDVIDVEVWKDEGLRELEVPASLENVVKKEGLMTFFEGLSFTHRKEYCRWVSEAKREETRTKRLEKAVEMMRKGVKTPG